MVGVVDTARSLINREERRAVLTRLLRLQSQGEDVSPVAVDIVRYCLESTSARDTGILSLSLEILSSQPDHPSWDVATSILANLLQNGSENLMVTVLDRAAQLPGQILRIFVLKSGVETARLAREGSLPVRRAALRIACLASLRAPPLDAPPRKVEIGFAPEAEAEMQKTDEGQLTETVAALTNAVKAGVLDSDDSVVAETLKSIATFASQQQATATADAAAAAATVAANKASTKAIAAPPQSSALIVDHVFEHINEISTRVSSMEPQWKRKAISAMSTLVALVLTASDADEARKGWAFKWLDGPMSGLLSVDDVRLSLTAAMGVAYVVSSASAVHQEELLRSAQRVLPVLIRLSGDSSLSRAQKSTAARTATKVLSIVQAWKAPERLVLSAIAQLLALNTSIYPAAERIRGTTTLAQLMLKLDVVDSDGVTAPSTTWILNSGFVKGLMEGATADPTYPAEVVCILCGACLRTIKYVVGKRPNRMQVLECWFAAIVATLDRCFGALAWSRESTEVLLAKEYVLKLFELAMEVDAFVFKHKRINNAVLVELQKGLISTLKDQKNVIIKAVSALFVIRYCSEDVLTSGDNGKRVLVSLWSLLQKSYEDGQRAVSISRKGVLWTPMPFLSTLKSDNILLVDLATRLLVQRIPNASERASAMLERYQSLLDEAREVDFIAEDIVQSSIQAVEAYQTPDVPKPVEAKVLPSFVDAPSPDPLMFLPPLFDGAIVASTRTIPEEEQRRCTSLEAQLFQDDGRAPGPAQASRVNIRSRRGKQGGMQLILSDKDIELKMNHGVDLSRNLILVRVAIQNTGTETISSLELRASMESGGLSLASPVSRLHMLPGGSERLRGFTLHVAKEDNYDAAVLQIVATYCGAEGDQVADCEAYKISPYDACFLFPPPASTVGLGMWRRRWDLCKHSRRLNVFIRPDQTLDDLVQALQKSVLTEVHRMRSQMQFSCLLCSSTIGAYVTAGVFAPEADRGPGRGPCMALIELRSVSPTLLGSLSKDLADVLHATQMRLLSEEESRRSEKAQPSGSFFVYDRPELTIHQRWREAHRARLAI